jgi:hypothetical protein
MIFLRISSCFSKMLDNVPIIWNELSVEGFTLNFSISLSMIVAKEIENFF